MNLFYEQWRRRIGSPTVTAVFVTVVFLFSSPLLFAQCTNCLTTTADGYTTHVFGSGSGSFTAPEGVTTVDYLLLGGGGGGGGGRGAIFFIGARGGRGGHAAELLSDAEAVTPGQTYVVVVGAGGSGGSGGSGAGTSGDVSSFGIVTAVGGAGGESPVNGAGGGTGGNGAGSAGTGAAGNAGGAGGAGEENDLSGALVAYAGGGGGGGVNAAGGAGGIGGGGNGGNSAVGASGAANRGGGGGGGGATGGFFGVGYSGGNGGSGLVIIRYASGPRYAVNDGNWHNSNTWSLTGCDGTAGASVPAAANDVVICNRRSVDITADAAAKSVTLETGNQSVNLNHVGGASLAVGSGGVTLEGGTSGGGAKSWNIGAGSATVEGPVALQGGTNSNRTVRIEVSSGSLDINGDLSFISNGPDRAVIEATGAAVISLSGAFNVSAGHATLIPGTNSTFIYDGTGTQTALIGVSNIDYHHLTFGGSGTKNQSTNDWGRAITGTTRVNSGVAFNNSASLIYQGEYVNDGTTVASAAQEYNGNFISGGTYTASAAQEYRADFTNTGTFNAGTSRHSFNGPGFQTITGETTFGTLAIDNTAGVAIDDDIHVNNQLVLTNGVVTTGDNVLRVAQTTWSGITRAGGWVAGNLGLWLPIGWQERLFPLGDSSAYMPVNLTLPNVSTAGFIVARISQNTGDHPQLDTSDLDVDQSVNRWWHIESEGATAASMDAVFNFLESDLDSGADSQAFAVRRYSGGTWSEPTTGTRTTTSTEATGIGGFGEFAIGEIGASAQLMPVAEWRFDENSWNGSAGEVLDSSGNSLHGTANGGASTDDAAPAQPGDPGTCAYGSFDGVDDYVEVSGISSTLNATASLAFWIRTTQSGSNTVWQAPGVTGVEMSGGEDDIFWGWLDATGRIGISVGNANTTKSTVAINNGAWRHVALTRDHSAGTYKIYIDGNLNASGSIAGGTIGSAYSSIGRIQSTDGSAVYLEADLDEVRIYDGVLTDADVASIMQETHPCTPQLCPTGVPQGGLIGDYYNGMTFSGGIVGSRVDGPVDFNWADGSPGVAGVGANQFSVEWNGYLRVAETGIYRFQTQSDDGVRLTVNNQVVIEQWNDHAARIDNSGPVSLEAGEVYPVRLQFYENGGQAVIRLRWQTPSSGAFVPIPAGDLPPDAGLYSCTSYPISHYGISHSGTGLTCEAEPITITAYDASGNSFPPPAGTQIVLSTDPDTGAWAGGNTFTFSGTEDSVVKNLWQTTPATLNINVTDGVTTESPAEDPAIEFGDAVVRFYGNSSRTPIPHQVAGRTDTNPVLTVVRSITEEGSNVCVVQSSGRTLDVELGFECRNPDTCNGGVFEINGTAIAANDGVTLDGGGDPALTALSLNFPPDGFASIPVRYSDVGRVRLHGRVQVPTEDENEIVTVSGSSGEFVVKPHSLTVVSVQPPPEPAGPGFASAGQTFGLEVEARNAEGDPTPNFGREQTPETLTLDWEVSHPSAAVPGTLNGANNFSAIASAPGSFENLDLSWTEVGDLELTVRLADNDYLGAGNVVSQPVETVGRFYPHYFELTDDSATPACGSFSYLEQDAIHLEYTISAHNAEGGIVQNYDSVTRSFDSTAAVTHSVLQTPAGMTSSDEDRLSPIEGEWTNGQWLVDKEDVAFARKREDPEPEAPIPDLQVSARVAGAGIPMVRSEDDLADCGSLTACEELTLGDSLEMRFGRLRLDDAFGPETVDMPVRFRTEWWNGERFVRADDDFCTAVPRSAIIYPDGTISADSNRTVAVGAGSTTGEYGTIDSTHVFFERGDAEHYFTAPGAGNEGNFQVRVNLENMPWLRHAWNQSSDCEAGDPDGDSCYDVQLPPATFTFGSYRGHDRIIYWREVFD